MIRFAPSMPPRCPTRPYWRPGAAPAPTRPTRRKRGYAGLARQSDHTGERGPDAPGQLFVVRHRAHGTAGRFGCGAQVSVVAECEQRTQGDGDGPANNDHRHHWCPHALAGREGTALAPGQARPVQHNAERVRTFGSQRRPNGYFQLSRAASRWHAMTAGCRALRITSCAVKGPGRPLERCFAGRQRGRRAGRQPTPLRVAGRATRPIHTPRGVGHQGRAHQATTKPRCLARFTELPLDVVGATLGTDSNYPLWIFYRLGGDTGQRSPWSAELDNGQRRGTASGPVIAE